MTITPEVLDDSKQHLALIQESSDHLKKVIGKIPEILIVAGSGLGGIVDYVNDAKEVSYDELPNFPQSTVVGHAGKLVWGNISGKPVLVMAGRKHVYEGIDIRQAVLPLRAIIHAGVKDVILSNAAGGLNRQFTPGELMLIDDHIQMQFQNPLIGSNIDEIGPRFPDMSDPYNKDLRQLARDVALELKLKLHEGTYVALTGPTYETQAEVGMLRMMGDAVGMSTAPETIVANHAGARVLGISAITNSHVIMTGAKTTHAEVIEIGKAVGVSFCNLVSGIVARIS